MHFGYTRAVLCVYSKERKCQIWCVAGRASWRTRQNALENVKEGQRFWMTEQIGSSQFHEVKETTYASPVIVLMKDPSSFICLLNYEDNVWPSSARKSWLSIQFKWEPCISILWYSFGLTVRSAWLPMWSKFTTCPLHVLATCMALYSWYMPNSLYTSSSYRECW
jgi:hypothetical protein